MKTDFKVFLWSLKLGALLNLYLLAHTFVAPLAGADAHLLIPARILLAVSAYRCLFPVNYQDNIVLHDSPFSSIFFTRLLATFSELALVGLFSHLLRILNVSRLAWVDLLSWGMLGAVGISQVFVWGQILTGRLMLFFYEELGWALIFAANTAASVFLFTTGNFSGDWLLLIQLNLLIGAVYLPWQVIHLRFLLSNAHRRKMAGPLPGRISRDLLLQGLRRSIHLRNPSSAPDAWGGWVGAIWMTAYWASLIPLWVFAIMQGV